MKIKVVQHPAGTVRIITHDSEPSRRWIQKAVPDCERCKTDGYIPHFNCMYDGKAIGHSESHCTANACY